MGIRGVLAALTRASSPGRSAPPTTSRTTTGARRTLGSWVRTSSAMAGRRSPVRPHASLG